MKIRVCVPFYSEFEFAKSGLKECLKCSEIEFSVEPRQGTIISRLRNSLLNDGKSKKVSQSPVSNFDYFLFVDSDIGFTLDNVLKLLSQDKEIIASPYLCHDNNGTYQCGVFYSDQPGNIKYRYTIYEKGTKEVDFVGAGFLLIKRSALEKIEFPWFREMLLEVGQDADIIGEDIGFCLNARKSGLKVYCDFDNPVKHNLRTANSFNWNLN